MINFDRSTYKSDRQDCPCVQRLNSKNSNDERATDEEAAVAEVGETKANEVAGEKTSFCPESLAGCSPFAKVRCTPTTPWYRYQPSLRRPDPPVLATNVGVHVVRVRRRVCTLVSREERK